MPLGRGHHVFHSIVYQLDRAARLECEQGRMRRDVRRILLFSAESSARLGLHDSNVGHGASQDDGESTMSVVRALDRAIDCHPAIFRDRDHALWLDVDMLLMSGTVGAFDDVVGGRKAGLDVALLDEDRLELGGRPLGIEDRLTGLFVELDGCSDQSLAVFVRKQEHRLRSVANVALDQTRLVVGDERDHVLTRDVSVVHDGEAGGIEVEMDAVQRATRNRRADRQAVEHSWEPEVVGIACLAGGLSDSVLPWHAATNGIQHVQSLLTWSRLGEPGQRGSHEVSISGGNHSVGQCERVLEADSSAIAARTCRVDQRPRGRVHAVQQPHRRDPAIVENCLGLRDGRQRLGGHLLLRLEHDSEASVSESALDEALGADCVRHAGLDADMSPEKVGGQLRGPLFVKIDGHEVWKHGPLFDSAEPASGIGDDPGAGADAEGHAVLSHFGDCPCHPRRGQGLTTVAIPHVEVHGTGAGRRGLLGGRRDLRG